MATQATATRKSRAASAAPPSLLPPPPAPPSPEPPPVDDGYTGKPELKALAYAIHKGMLATKMNASSLARAVWGTHQDGRGYEVAKNRDRIGFYLKGTACPNDENLDKIAEALKVPAEDLRNLRPIAGVQQLRPSKKADISVTLSAGDRSKALMFGILMKTSTALAIFKLLQEDDTEA